MVRLRTYVVYMGMVLLLWYGCCAMVMGGGFVVMKLGSPTQERLLLADLILVVRAAAAERTPIALMGLIMKTKLEMTMLLNFTWAWSSAWGSSPPWPRSCADVAIGCMTTSGGWPCAHGASTGTGDALGSWAGRE